MSICLRRRQFIAGLGGTAAWPLMARAQRSGNLPTIGFLGGDATVWGPWQAAFAARLRELGWTEGRVAIEYRWAVGLAMCGTMWWASKRQVPNETSPPFHSSVVMVTLTPIHSARFAWLRGAT
jgi:hypothetical protein